MARPRRAEFHPRLADFRQRAGLTQEQVAEHVGITAEMVRRHERGESMPIAHTEKGTVTFSARQKKISDSAVAQLMGPPSKAGDRRQASSSRANQFSTIQISPAEFGDSEYLESVRGHTQEIVKLDNQFGGADLVRLSTRLFRTVHNQLGVGAYDLKLERDLHSAAGELAEVVGWLAYDAEEHDLARRMNQESLYFTRLCGDKTTELLTLQNSSMHAASQGRPREALQIVRSVLEGDYRLSARLRTLFLTRKARALAQCGDESALQLFPEIRGLFLDGASDDDPAWAWWVDERELLWHEAMAHRDLGLTDQAVNQFEKSAAAVPANETRSQYVHRSHLLQAQIENKCWAEAEGIMTQLIPLSMQVASTRAVVLLRNVLAQVATANGTIPPGVHEQAARLSAALDTSPV